MHRMVVGCCGRYEELTKEERLLTQEVAALDRRFDLWVVGAGAAPSGPVEQRPQGRAVAPGPSARDITADLPPEVAAFEVGVTVVLVVFC